MGENLKGKKAKTRKGRSKKTNKYECQRRIIEDGKFVIVVLSDPRETAKVDSYDRAKLKSYVHGDSSDLEKFKDIEIVDAYGKKHRLETNLDLIDAAYRSIDRGYFEPEVYHEDGEEYVVEDTDWDGLYADFMRRRNK